MTRFPAHGTWRGLLLAASTAACLTACNATQAPGGDATPQAAAGEGATTAAPPAGASASACTLLDAATMSGILGETLTAVPDDTRLELLHHTECRYFGTDPDHFAIMIYLQRGNGKELAEGMQVPPHGAATADNPYADLGDGAMQQGPILNVLIGTDLLVIDSRPLFAESQDMAKRRHVAERIVQILTPKLAANPVAAS